MLQKTDVVSPENLAYRAAGNSPTESDGMNCTPHTPSARNDARGSSRDVYTVLQACMHYAQRAEFAASLRRSMKGSDRQVSTIRHSPPCSAPASLNACGAARKSALAFRKESLQAPGQPASRHSPSAAPDCSHSHPRCCPRVRSWHHRPGERG